MDILKILKQVASSELPAEEAFEQINKSSYYHTDIANLDFNREERIGFPEAVFGLSKTSLQLTKITKNFLDNKKNLIITKLDKKKITHIKSKFKNQKFGIDYEAGILYKIFKPYPKKKGNLAVISAGTSDIPVAQEAFTIAKILGNDITLFTDCGVAGIHRIYDKIEILKKSSCIIVVAGMEGALPSVISGLTGRLVIAVPTSVGYGAHLNGFVPLLGMLNSCSPTVVTVNIDNGFGAAYSATAVNQYFS